MEISQIFGVVLLVIAVSVSIWFRRQKAKDWEKHSRERHQESADFKELRLKADAGDAEAQYEVGMMLKNYTTRETFSDIGERMKDIGSNEEGAKLYLEKALENGIEKAQEPLEAVNKKLSKKKKNK